MVLSTLYGGIYTLLSTTLKKYGIEVTFIDLCSLSPFNSFMFNLGLETLHLRMEKHSQNALELAKYLENNEKVSWVNYPKLESQPNYELSQKYLPLGGSGILTF